MELSSERLAGTTGSLTRWIHSPTIGSVETQVTQRLQPAIGWAAVSLFLSLCCFYLLIARGRITSGDEWYVYGTTESLVERGSWRLQVEGIDREFSRYSVLPSLLGVPFYWVGQRFADWCEASRSVRSADSLADTSPFGMSRRSILVAAVSLQTPFVTAATAALLFFGICRFFDSPGAALATTLVFAIGTLSLPYSGSMFIQPLAAFGLTWLLVSASLDVGVSCMLSLILLLAVRLEYAILIPILAIHSYRFQRYFAQSLGWIVVGAVVGVGISVAVNVFRGDPILFGDYGAEGFTTSVWIGLHGLLFSTGKGIIWLAPVVAVGLALMPLLSRSVPRIGLLAGWITVISLLMASCWWAWHGALSWGPRLLVPLMPIMVLPLAGVFRDWTEKPSSLRYLILFLVFASSLVQFRGALADPVGNRRIIAENESIYIPQTGPLSVKSEGFPDLLLWRLGTASPDLRSHIIAIAMVLLLMVGVFGLYTTWVLQLSQGWVRNLVPSFTSHDLVTAATAMLLAFAPSAFCWILVYGSGQNGGWIPKGQFYRFTMEPGQMHMVGQLYVPLSGDYRFYRSSLSTHYRLNRTLLFGSPDVTPPMSQSVMSLERGFHQLVVQENERDDLGCLYWTTPGNAHYKERIPHIYLVSDVVSWQAETAIELLRWKWLGWVAAVVWLISASSFWGETKPQRFRGEIEKGN